LIDQAQFPGVKIGEGCRLFANVRIGSGSIIHGPAVIGHPPRGTGPGELPVVIGTGAIVRPFTTIYAGNSIGDDFQTGQGVSIRENNRIGDGVSIGTNSVLEFDNQIGDDVRIHSGCFLEMVVVADHVFIGPNTVFTDDPHPMNCPRYKECLRGARVEELARIGANVTVLPGVVIGRNSLIGAGSVVVDDVPANTVVAGSPARVIKKIEDLTCPPGFFDKPYSWPPYHTSSPPASEKE
jgi:acetyltransferase-like isoleucine patch superfamily enzyme